MATVTRLLAYEDWLAMPPAGEGKEEVVNGELQVSPPNDLIHARTVQRIVSRISRQIDENRIDLLGSSVNLLISAEPLASRARHRHVLARSRQSRRKRRPLFPEIRILDGGKYRTDKIVAEGVISPVRFPDVKISAQEIWTE